jgi:serine/threonine-protein kinase
VAVGAGAVWVTSEGDNTLTRIDARTAKVVGSPIAVGRAPSSVAVGPDAVWVANRDGNSVTRVSLG